MEKTVAVILVVFTLFLVRQLIWGKKSETPTTPDDEGAGASAPADEGTPPTKRVT